MDIKQFNRLVRNANRRIARIKERGMQPITLKSPADLISRYIHEKGTGREGLIRSFDNIRQHNKEISEQQYMEDLQAFLDSPYGEQTRYSGARDYYRSAGMDKLRESGQFDDETLEKIEKLSDADFISLFNEAGDAGDKVKDKGGSSDYFYTFIQDYIDYSEDDEE